MDFFFRTGMVLHTSRDDDEFAGCDIEALIVSRFVTVVHAKTSMHDQEEFVLVVVVVPDELALKLDQLDLLSIQFADNLRAPVIRERG